MAHEKQGHSLATLGNSLWPTMRALGYSSVSALRSDQREAF